MVGAPRRDFQPRSVPALFDRSPSVLRIIGAAAILQKPDLRRLGPNYREFSRGQPGAWITSLHRRRRANAPATALGREDSVDAKLARKAANQFRRFSSAPPRTEYS